jgi:hypothetical protein
MQRNKILTSGYGTEVMIGLIKIKGKSGGFVFKFTAGKVVNSSGIIRKDSFIS